jgi:quinol monooxygenase YgiN
MSTILAHISIHPGREAEFEDLVRTLHAATQAEPGKHHYEYWRGATPSLYYCLLAYENFNAFINHQTSDHHEQASPILGELIADMTLEWVDPVGGASDLPATASQALPADANELTTTYHGLFAAQLQDWWQPLRDRKPG